MYNVAVQLDYRDYSQYSFVVTRAGFRGGVGPRAPGPPPTGGLPPIQFKLINCKK